MYNMHITLIAHSQVKMWDPTPECQNQIYPRVEAFHGSFTDSSRPFHEFSRSFHMFGFCVVRVLFFTISAETVKTSISYQTNIGKARLQRPSFKPVAPRQVAGNVSLYSDLIRRDVRGDQDENRCTSFCYTIMMLMGNLGDF